MDNQLWNLKFKLERNKMKLLTDFLQSRLPNSTFKESSLLESGFLWRNLFSTDQKKYFPAMWIFYWTYRFQSRAVFPSWRLSFPKLFDLKQHTQIWLRSLGKEVSWHPIIPELFLESFDKYPSKICAKSNDINYF